jgi:hypothetical protein
MLGLITFTAGQNHPVRIPQRLTMQPPLVPASSASTSLLKNGGTLAWPKRGSSKQISTSYQNQSGSVSKLAIRPIVVPKFVSEPGLSVQPGYQEAHKLYDEMRQFFAQKAMSVHGGEVVVVKVTMMSSKPGNRNPSIISVSTQTNVNLNHSDPSCNRTYRKRFLIYLFTLVFEILRLSHTLLCFLPSPSGPKTISYLSRIFDSASKIGLS